MRLSLPSNDAHLPLKINSVCVLFSLWFALRGCQKGNDTPSPMCSSHGCGCRSRGLLRSQHCRYCPTLSRLRCTYWHGNKDLSALHGDFVRTFAGRNEWASLQRNVRSQKILEQRALNQKDPAPAFCRCNDSKDGIWSVPWAAAPIARAVEPIAWAAAPIAWAAEPTAWAAAPFAWSAEPLHGVLQGCEAAGGQGSVGDSPPRLVGVFVFAICL